jgi:MOSC domain-containing protein YiiM
MPVSTEPDTSDSEALARLAKMREGLRSITYSGYGQLADIVVSPAHGEHILRTEARILPGIGVEGDRPYKQYWKGRKMSGRAVSAMNAEVLDALGISYETPGDNLIISGIDLAALSKGDAIKVGDAILIATGAAHHPCKYFLQWTSTAHYTAIHDGRFRGTMFDALDAATVKVGDAVERVISE